MNRLVFFAAAAAALVTMGTFAAAEEARKVTVKTSGGLEIYSAVMEDMRLGETRTVEGDANAGSATLHKSDGRSSMQGISDSMSRGLSKDYLLVATGKTDSEGKATFTLPASIAGAQPRLTVFVTRTEQGVSRITGKATLTLSPTGPAVVSVQTQGLTRMPQAPATSPALAAYTSGIAGLDFLGLDAAIVALMTGPQTAASLQAGIQGVKSRADAISAVLKTPYPGQDATAGNIAKLLTQRFGSYVSRLQRLADLAKKGTLKPSDYPGAVRCWQLQQWLLHRLKLCQVAGTPPAECRPGATNNVIGNVPAGIGGLDID